MKIYKKTYGVRGLVEWQAIIHAGKARLIVHFTGGSITAYGVTPATYTTENPAHQAIIETSNHFKSGRITLEKSVFVKEVQDPVASPAAAPASAPAEIPATETSAPAPAAEFPADSAGQVEVKEPEVGSDGFKTVEVTCFEDARRYLMDNYGYTPSAVRTKELARDKATANKLKIVIDGVNL